MGIVKTNKVGMDWVCKNTQ